MRSRRVSLTALVLALSITVQAQPGSTGGINSIQSEPLKEWLTYIASDALQGRRVFTEGLGLAAAYIADHLKEWGVEPAGDEGTYFQTVRLLGVKTASRARVTVDVNGRTRTFKDGEGILFEKNMGSKQTVTANEIVFAGYGLEIPELKIDDYDMLDPKGRIVVYLGPSGPSTVGAAYRRTLAGRSRLAVDKGAAAVIAPSGGFSFGRGEDSVGRRSPSASPPPARGKQKPLLEPSEPTNPSRSASQTSPDFTTVERYDRPLTPTLNADEEFFEFLFSASTVKYADLKNLAEKQEPLPAFTLKGVTLTITVDADYDVVTTNLTRNVVGMVEGTDPDVKKTYVLVGAHYDHIGFQDTVRPADNSAPEGCPGQTRDTPRKGDIINNGADDDGSGTVALMALARAFALGPKPRRSIVFIWHTAEESGLWGSRYMVDYPEVPLENVAAQLNVDMIGRNNCDDPSEGNTVYLVGADRISTELHNLSEEANTELSTPMKLDYAMNDPEDPESIYTRSDHYSYAAKGIPIIFYTTGMHRDYHYLTDEVGKIEFPKLAHVTQLVYQTAWKVANLAHVPYRDNKGPRTGKGKGGKLPLTPSAK
jgi:Peptidase family M28